MNEMIIRFLLARDKFMSEMHLKHLEHAAKIPGFTYNTCGKITRDKGRIQKLKGTGDSSYIF